MINSILINKQFFLLIDFVTLCFAFWVYFSDKKSRLNQNFSLMTFLIFLWITFGYLTASATQPNLALFWAKLAYGSVSLFFIPFYFFFLYFLNLEKKIRKLNKVIVLTGILLCILAIFSNIIVDNVEMKDWGVDLIFGRGSILFYGIAILLSSWIIFLLFNNYFKKSSKEKLKIQYFLIGAFIWIIINIIFNMVLPIWQKSIRYSLIGNYSAIFLLAFTAYAIVKKNLFGIKIVLTALLVSLIALSILIDIFFLTPDLLAKLFKTLLLVVFLYFGYSLIRSVIHEIQLREKLEKTYQELKKLNKAKSEFLSIASHQLRTPLSAIKGYISMLLEGSYGPLPEKAQKSISSVYQSNERLIKLVNDILNVSRIEAGGIEIDFQKIDLEEIIKSVINELSHGAQRKNIDLKFEKPSKPLPRIIADSDKMRHIILNIIDNAIRYTDKGEVITQIQPKNHNRIIIKIKDTGLGMTQKEIAKLFKSFSRGSAGNRSYTEGSGLGLYIAKRFVEMHHGKINAESKGLGKGSTITIEIPVQNSLL